jgi:hypothetical protein
MGKLPAGVRHLALAIAAVLIGWGGTDVIPFLNDHAKFGGPLAAAVVGALLAYFTPLVNSYGVGATTGGRANFGTKYAKTGTDL